MEAVLYTTCLTTLILGLTTISADMSLTIKLILSTSILLIICHASKVTSALSSVWYNAVTARTRQFAYEHKDFFEAVDYETMNAISIMTNGSDKFTRLMGKGKKVYNMCKAYQEMYEEGVEHGWNDGIRKSIILLRNVGIADDLIANMIVTEYNISAEEVQVFMQQ